MSTDIYEHKNYKKFVLNWVKGQPSRGRGQFRRFAEVSKASTTVMSQVFKGERDLTPEQAQAIAQYLGLDADEQTFFMNLVLQARAGTKGLRDLYQREMDRLKSQSQDLTHRLKVQAMDENDRATFYSHWIYSAVRNLAATSLNTVEALAEHFSMPRAEIKEVVEFLLRVGLLEQADGQLKAGQARTHLGKDSPLAYRHHMNWRQKAMQRYDNHHQMDHQEELALTFPVSLSKSDTKKIKAELVDLVARVNALIGGSPSEQGACLNIDWFRY